MVFDIEDIILKMRTNQNIIYTPTQFQEWFGIALDTSAQSPRIHYTPHYLARMKYIATTLMYLKELALVMLFIILGCVYIT